MSPPTFFGTYAYRPRIATADERGFTDVDLDDDSTTAIDDKSDDGLLDQSWATPIVHHPPLRSWTRNPLVYISVLAIGTSVFMGGAVVVGVATGMLRTGLEGRNTLEVVGVVGMEV